MRHNGRAAALHAQTLARVASEVSLLMVLVPFCHAQTLARATSEGGGEHWPNSETQSQRIVKTENCNIKCDNSLDKKTSHATMPLNKNPSKN